MKKDEKKKILIRMSWDDGDQLDLQLADMLLKYNIPSVFYIPANCDLTEGQIQAIAGQGDCSTCKKAKKLFDFGAHTITHPQDLKKLTYPDLVKEIKGSKEWLENIIKRPITRFCYPRGRYNEQVKKVVEEAGFKEARTTDRMNISFNRDKFAIKPTVHVYPEHKEYGDKTWKEVAEEKFEEVLEKGGRFELWGHSWEAFGKYHQEEFLDDFLWYIDQKMKEINYPRDISIPYFEIE